MVELAVQGRTIAVQVHQEQTVLVGLLLYFYQRAPFLQTAKDGGEIILSQLVWFAAAEYQCLHICGSDRATA